MQTLELKTITIKSIPQGAKIIVNGVEEGETDNQIFRYPGKYKIKLIKSGFLVEDKEITVTDSIENNFTFTLRKSTVTLILNVLPINAKVEINKKAYGAKHKIELAPDRKSTRLNSSHIPLSRMPSSA